MDPASLFNNKQKNEPTFYDILGCDLSSSVEFKFFAKFIFIY